MEACSWIEAAVEVPPHGVKEHKEGKKRGEEERLSGEFNKRATGRGERRQQQKNKESGRGERNRDSDGEA